MSASPSLLLAHYECAKYIALRGMAEENAAAVAAAWLIKNSGFIAVNEDAALQVGTHRLGQNSPFQVAPFADEVLRRITMADPDGVLRDDRTAIEFRGDVMAGCSNQLDAPTVGLAVGPGQHFSSPINHGTLAGSHWERLQYQRRIIECTGSHVRRTGAPGRVSFRQFVTHMKQRLKDFWQRVSEGLEIRVLWTQFFSEAKDSYSLYGREVDWDALKSESRFRRICKTCSALFWAMLLKLSPARRVFLLIALVFGILSLTSNTANVDGMQVRSPQISPLLPMAMLIFLLALELADRVIMKRDLEIAREIQRWLVPETPPTVPRLDLAFSSKPANTVGGDYYDAFPLDPDLPLGKENPVMLVVADVAGKSVPAALLMATFHASLRSVASVATSLTDIVTRMNRYCCAHSMDGRRFTTAFFAEYDPTSRSLTYVRAGHNEPFLMRATGQFETLDTGDLPLGIDPNAAYLTTEITLATGDLLLIYSDGLIEAVNDREEEFGAQRVIDLLKTAPQESAEQTLQRLLTSVRAFTGQRRQYDDLTAFVVRAT